jgi:hypothetical protein
LFIHSSDASPLIELTTDKNHNFTRLRGSTTFPDSPQIVVNRQHDSSLRNITNKKISDTKPTNHGFVLY